MCMPPCGDASLRRQEGENKNVAPFSFSVRSPVLNSTTCIRTIEQLPIHETYPAG